MRNRLYILIVALIALPVMVFALEVGKNAPAFSLRDLNGRSVSLASLRGKVVVIDFWASWCRPCVQAFPELAALQREYGNRGLAVLAVSIDENIASARRATQNGRYPFTFLHDNRGTVAGRYGVNERLPATIVVDRQGKVKLARFGAATDVAALRSLIRSLL